MKYIAKSSWCLLAAFAMFTACKKDQQKTTLNLANAKATLTASTSAPIVLDTTMDAKAVVVFSFDSVNFGYPTSGVTYTLQLDVPSDNFANPTSIVVPASKFSDTILGLALNNYATKFGIAGTSGEIDVRLKVVLVQNNTSTNSIMLAPIYSNTVPLTVTSYVSTKPIPFAYMWVVGDYMAWTWPPSSSNLADSIASVKSDGKYEGFVRIAGGTGTHQFKFCPAYSWSEAFADANASGAITTVGNVTTITMTTAGGTSNNLSVPSNGYYYMTADTTALTDTSILVNSFSVVGSATSSPVPLVYDTVAQHWKATNVTLAAGNINFVLNNGDPSSISFGKNSDIYHVTRGGAGIPVTAGTYTVILNLSHPGNYTDTVK